CSASRTSAKRRAASDRFRSASDPDVGDDAAVVAGPDAVDRLGAGEGDAFDPATAAGAAEADEDVVDAAIGLEVQGRVGVAIVPGETGPRAAHPPGVLVVGATAVDRGQAAEVADLVGVGIGVEIADD